MTKIVNITCEYRTNPLGIDVTAPRFGWQLHSDLPGVQQTAYRIFAASDPALLSEGQVNVWDSGKIESDQSVHVTYAGPPLEPRQRVYWNVTVWDESGSASQSEPAWFEMGLLNRQDWQAQWVGANLLGGTHSTVPAPYLRKSFTVQGAIKSARLYVTALGLFECSINGQLVSDDVFTPGWTDYHQRVQYNVYDIAHLLHGGENAIGAILGDGWAVGHLGWAHRQIYFDRPRLMAQLEITLEDGTMVTVATDTTWKYALGPLLENDFLMGEAYDARQENSGWDEAGFDDTGWLNVQPFDDPGMALVATNGPTVRRIDELKPINDPEQEGRFGRVRYVFDLGQNMVGWVRLKGSAPAGTTATLRFAEVLNPDGSLYTTNLRAARATDHYTFKGEGEEVWEPKFTFHGFRYVELSGYPGEIKDDTITGVVLHSEMPRTGEFECSDSLINQLQQNIVWGQKGNFIDVPTDCPQRDERQGWTGDIQVFAETAAYNFNVAGFMHKWMQDVVDSQNEQGCIPPIVPKAIAHTDDGGPAWADAAVICPWTIYLSYGDKRILEENYPMMTRFMAFMLDTSPGYIRCAPDFDGWPGFGDWLSINAETPRELIGTAFLAYDAHLMAQIADVLGKTDEADRYRKLFTAVKEAFGKRYLKGSQFTPSGELSEQMKKQVAGADATSRGNLKAVDYGPISSEVFNTDFFTPTQTSYVLALHFDLLPEDLRGLAVDELVADIERRELHLSTGFVGSPYLPHVLSSNGRLDIAYKLLNQKSWPSWLYAVTQGATTIWERWDGWTDENGFQDPGMNSFNHYAYGAIGAWLYNTVAGIKIDTAQPGYKHIILSPEPGGELTQACGKLNTLYGELRSEWQITDGTFDWTVVVPPNTTATVQLPYDGPGTLNGAAISGSVHELNAGTYQFSVAN